MCHLQVPDGVAFWVHIAAVTVVGEALRRKAITDLLTMYLLPIALVHGLTSLIFLEIPLSLILLDVSGDEVIK